jgi:hypothetical protein
MLLALLIWVFFSWKPAALALAWWLFDIEFDIEE